MGIIAFIILGLLAGAIAKALMPGDDPAQIGGAQTAREAFAKIAAASALR